MDTRREFLKKVALLSGSVAWSSAFPESIRKAMAIDPSPGSTYLDAEHVVILMQENRSFDHCFGALKGVRGFNDPRAIRLAGGNPVWLQTNRDGETYAPFRFDIRDTKITWMGSIPHVRSSQVDAFNQGHYDQWLNAKRSHNPQYRHIPLTLGHYTREDLPFNYAMADAFTVCDQNFCSGMTSTWPNRLFLWSGTIRGEQNGEAKPFIRNDIPYGEAHWTTFPELLERSGVSWRVYQNDLTCGGGFKGEERAWLANFGCNLLESFSQYNVRFSDRYVRGLQAQAESLPPAIEAMKAKGGNEKEIAKKEEVLQSVRVELARWTRDNYDRLTPEEKNLYKKAFTINTGDPHYHQLDKLMYEENGKQRELEIPRGDILHQFREDVNKGKLPAVSWLVGPENFSDHPTAPWYGAWYVSEILDILTKNPEVWKKTIFILTYDENDGYFDHVPPFVAPDPKNVATGKCSAGIRTDVEYIRLEQELRLGVASKEAREGPVGLGYRVPMIIASPWSRGGRVCSQVFDHTSVFRFVQGFLNKKYNKQIEETNVSLWRKTVSGDLTSVFQQYDGEKAEKLPWLQKRPFIESIYNAKFREEPANYKALSPEEIAQFSKDPYKSSYMAHQEPGIKPSCALPYELYADAWLSEDRRSVEVVMAAGKEVFGARSAGSPFNIFHPSQRSRSYAVIAGDELRDSYTLSAFGEEGYRLQLQGPNGFARDLRGDEKDPGLTIRCGYESSPADPRLLTGRLAVAVVCFDTQRSYRLVIRDHSYHGEATTHAIAAGSKQVFYLDTKNSYGWYDAGITVEGFDRYERRYSGRVETGHDSFTDPYMGRQVISQ